MEAATIIVAAVFFLMAAGLVIGLIATPFLLVFRLLRWLVRRSFATWRVIFRLGPPKRRVKALPGAAP